MWPKLRRRPRKRLSRPPGSSKSVPPLLDQLLVPPRLALQGLEDVRRIADAAVGLGELARELRGGVRPIAARLDDAIAILASVRDDIAGLRSALEPMSEDLDGLRQAFQGSNVQLERLREAMTPELQGIRAAAEPLHEELGNQRESIDALGTHLEELGGSLSRRIEELGRALGPLERDISDVRDVVEPLHGATERVGRVAERLPGSGKRRERT